MNWKSIKEKYPKAFAELLEGTQNQLTKFDTVGDLVAIGHEYVFFGYNPRDLYDHFDGLELYLSIELSLTTDDERVFYPIIYSNDRIIYGYNEGDYLSDRRVKSETRGFEKLFEIREKQLEGEQLNE